LKEHLPEDSHNKWPKHVGGYTDYDVINPHTCIRTCGLYLVGVQWIFHSLKIGTICCLET